MSNPPSGFGRGGRGAALAQLLNQQVRRPGDSTEGVSHQPTAFGAAQSQQSTAGISTYVPQQQPAGHSVVNNGVQKVYTNGNDKEYVSGSRESFTQPVRPSIAVVTTTPVAAPIIHNELPTASGGAAGVVRPAGRGAMLQRMIQQTQQSMPITNTVPPVESSVGLQSPITISEVIQPPRSRQQSVTESTPPAEPLMHGGLKDIAAALSGASGDNVRVSYQQQMLTRLNVDDPVVSRSGKAGESVRLACNYIALKCRNEGVYQYAVSFSPEVDSLFIRHKLIEEAHEILGRIKSFDGRILFLPIKTLQQEMMIPSKLPTDGSAVKMFIKLVKVVPASSCLQLFNITFRKALSKLKMCAVRRDYFLPDMAIAVPQHKLEVWPGYITAIDEYEGGLLMLTDVKHRVLRTQTVLDIMSDCFKKNRSGFKEEVAKQLIGAIVLTRYNNKSYRVEDIAWDMNPTKSFPTTDGPETTFVEYYQKAYNKQIKDLGQPLLISKLRKQDMPKRGPKKADLADHMICLIPEFCFMTGLTDEMRNDFRVMKDLATHTRVPPAARRQALCNLAIALNSNSEARAELDKWGLVIDNDIMQLPGRILPREKIFLGGNREVDSGLEADWGRDVTRNQVIAAIDVYNWMIIVDQRNQPQASEFVQTYKRCGNDMGIRVGQPLVCVLANDRTESYVNEIKNKLTPEKELPRTKVVCPGDSKVSVVGLGYKKLADTVQGIREMNMLPPGINLSCWDEGEGIECQLVVTVFPSSRDDRYSAVKKLCCVDHPVPSQVINSKTISDQRKLRSVTQKIALQINCKLGGELWSVKIPTSGLMVCGIDTYHEVGKKSNSWAGFVSSTNETCTRWYSRVCGQNPHEELINGLKPCFTAALRKYHEVNHKLPKWIFMFRDGVGDGQLSYTAEFEVPQLSECFQNFGADYCPKLAFIVVQKRINQRIFKMAGQTQMENPSPGTVLDHTVTRRNWADFFLISQHVRQGTVSPTHYVIVYDSTGLDIDRLQSISYKMTHLYYNWPGTVRVPAPCQYAHKLAYLVGQNLRRMPSEVIADRLFFL